MFLLGDFIVEFVQFNDDGELAAENVLSIGRSPILSISVSRIDNTVAMLDETALYLVPLEVVQKEQQLVFVIVVV